MEEEEQIANVEIILKEKILIDNLVVPKLQMNGKVATVLKEAVEVVANNVIAVIITVKTDRNTAKVNGKI